MRRPILACILLAAALRAGEPLRIACLGDSITGDRPGKPHLHQYLKWTDLLQMLIEDRAGAGSAIVINSGWAGDTTHGKPSRDPPGAVARLRGDVLDHRPDICVLLIGGNNFATLQRQPDGRAAIEERFRTDLDGMVRTLREAGVRTLLLQYHEPRAADPATQWSHLDDGNAIIAAVAAAHDQPVLALEPAFAAARAAGAPAESLLNQQDGVHLAPGGEIVVARAVASRLRALGWLPPDRP